MMTFCLALQVKYFLPLQNLLLKRLSLYHLHIWFFFVYLTWLDHLCKIYIYNIGERTVNKKILFNSIQFLYLLQLVMKIDFETAARGGYKEMEVNVIDICPKCRGTRCELGTKSIRCTYCQGSGYETTTTGENNLYLQAINLCVLRIENMY